mgnify:FL=1
MQTMQELEISLPSAEYKVTFSDEPVMPLSVHPNESLEASLVEMVEASGKSVQEISSVKLERTFDLQDEHPELLE